MVIYGKLTKDIAAIKFAVDFVWNLGWTTYSLKELYVVLEPVYIAVISDGRRIRRIGFNRTTGKWKLLPDIQ